jgi:Sigma-70, region 4
VPLDALAPDQRAVLQLVLQRERSYGQIAELLGISEDAVRARAHAGLAALAPGVELPADKVAQVADFLLGQQNGKPRQATRRLLRSSEGAREWAATVAAELEDMAGDRLPSLPAAKTEPADAPEEPAAAAKAPRPRPLRDEVPAPRPRPRAPETAAVPGGEPPRRSSRLGGALLIGGLVVVLVPLLLWLFVFKHGDDAKPTAASPTPTSTAGQPREVGQIQLRGTGGSKATAVMRLFTAQQQLAFTLEGQNVPASRQGEAYAVWFENPSGKAQRLGYAAPVTQDGKLGTTGPREEDLSKFPKWLATYRQVVVSRDRSQSAKKPGPLVLRGTLPRGQG